MEEDEEWRYGKSGSLLRFRSFSAEKACEEQGGLSGFDDPVTAVRHVAEKETNGVYFTPVSHLHYINADGYKSGQMRGIVPCEHDEGVSRKGDMRHSPFMSYDSFDFRICLLQWRR